MGSIEDNLQAVRARIVAAARLAGRDPESIKLLAVSKTWPADRVRAAALAGQRAFGENYVQEGVAKRAELAALGLEWHFIGPLQSNKTRAVAEAFDWVHSVDRLKVAERLSAQRPDGLPALNVCVQVNVDGEATKGGCLPGEVQALARAVSALPRLCFRGLMAIPAPAEELAAQRRPFATLAALAADLRAAGLPAEVLSMGMSHDLEAAVLEGATLVRIGTSIFGERSKT